MIFALADVLRAEQLRQANERCPLLGGLANTGDGFREVRFGIVAHAHLHKADFELRRQSLRSTRGHMDEE